MSSGYGSTTECIVFLLPSRHSLSVRKVRDAKRNKNHDVRRADPKQFPNAKAYIRRAKTPASSNGAKARYDAGDDMDGAAERLVVVKTSWKEMSLELKQFVELTSGTSSGSAKVMSAHCQICQHRIPHQFAKMI